MTDLLQQAIAKIEKLPDESQNAVASRILDDIADEQAWGEQFQATSDEQWDRMRAMVQRDIDAEGTVPLDDVFPPGLASS